MIPSFDPERVPIRLAVKVKAKAESYIRQGHPWVFESSIVKISKDGSSGDLAIIFDQRKNKYMGVGYRLLFGENDGLPGLICDVYSDVAVVKLYSSIWTPYLHWIIQSIIDLTGSETVVLRMSRLLQKELSSNDQLYDGAVIYGQLANPEIIFEEHGVQFVANVIKGHKTGYFLDHRENRRKVGAMSKGKSVLDVFSYAGGFSTHAAAGGAEQVVSIDISKQALLLATRNVELNRPGAPHETMAIDAFEGMQALIDSGRRFDIVVVDPPSFAKMAADIPVAIKSYERLARLAIQLVARYGVCVMASCSSRIGRDEFFDLVEKNFDQSDRAYRLVEKSYHDIDHPISFPEGSYLKTGYYQMD